MWSQVAWNLKEKKSVCILGCELYKIRAKKVRDTKILNFIKFAFQNVNCFSSIQV
jgi:hypothetical protein